ncbi:hypothetical protein Pme01_23500 [Planosporangium mesophilum]|uniref:Uncharacterized protein n=1 Tax=Planosporangium mesophilum TaxID=689768 RepID=A0A8J3T9L3_9ACTN|nr:hypothetical protein Pme01_23500 [Planosporangium mesophilum]
MTGIETGRRPRRAPPDVRGWIAGPAVASAVERDGLYVYLNTRNPAVPIDFDQTREKYVVRPGFGAHPVVGVPWLGAKIVAESLAGRLPSGKGVGSVPGQERAGRDIWPLWPGSGWVRWVRGWSCAWWRPVIG